MTDEEDSDDSDDSEDGDDSSDSNNTPSERLRAFPSDLLEKFGVPDTKLSSLGKEDAAKLVDGLHSVGFSVALKFDS